MSEKMLTFSEWKTKTISSLMKIYESTEDKKLRQDIDALINKLTYLKSRDLSMWLRLLHEVIKHHVDYRKQLLALVPSEEQITYWFSREE